MTLPNVPTAPPINVYAGDTLNFPEYVFEASNDVPVDLSAWTWRCMWRRYPTSAEEITLTVDDSDAATGVIRISATPEQTTAMGYAGVWDLEGTSGDEIQTWLTGTTVYSLDVTR